MNQAKLCGAGLIAGAVAAYALSLATPSLLAHHSLLLEAFSGNVPSVITGGARVRTGHESLLLVLVAPVLGVLFYDVFFWWAGRLWGNTVLIRFARTPKARQRLLRTEGWVARRGFWTLLVSYFLPVPNAALYVLCGTSGMRLGVFLLGDALGTLLWTSFIAALGWQIGKPALDVVDAINHYSLILTVALVAGVLLLSRARRRRARSQ
ncbi:MAG: rane protein [Frankiales bacterium]|nr:rane protein [Frankiales bacterium]